MSLVITKGQIGNALTSTASDHVVAVTGDLYDETLEKYQGTINGEVKNKLESLEDGVEKATMVLMTEEEYDALSPKDPDIFYAIYEE